MILRYLLFLICPLSLSTVYTQSLSIDIEEEAIQPSKEQPGYWNYQGRPTLLLGGSNEDNLFQVPDLIDQLNLLQSVGGNYVRNTMSSRDPGNLWPFSYNDTLALFDLDHWNQDYWSRFSFFLEETYRRNIVVQIELWATFDYYRENWDRNPFNPKNNTNYSPERVKLPISIATHPIYTENPFFWSVPQANNNIKLLQYQQAFIDKILSYSLLYPHVLYCIDNETSVTAAWGSFWSNYVKKVAGEHGRDVYTTEMWDPWDLDHISHRETFDHPELYDFIEISQNNHQIGADQWHNGLKQIDRLREKGDTRPFTSIKVYGNREGGHGGGAQNGIESFVRNVLMGLSAIRFHRPPHGLGLNDTASTVLRGLRLLVDSTDFFKTMAVDLHSMSDGQHVVYERSLLNKTRILYFPKAGAHRLNSQEEWDLKVINLLSSEWIDKGMQRSNELSCDLPHTIFVLGPTD